MSRAVFCSRWFWSTVLFVLAIVQIAHRTPPVRVDSFFFDFSNVYSASRAWIHGQDAYRLSSVFQAWDGSHHGSFLGTTRQEGMQTWAAVYPPSSLLMFSPFAAMDAVPAHICWMVFNLILLGLTFPALFELAKLRSWSARVLLVTASLASAPLQCAIGSGQPALPACALLILAVWAYSRQLITLSGILLGLAAAIKIQIGGPFLLYYLFLRQWRLVALASLVFLSLSLLAVARLEAAGIKHWATSWHQNITTTLEPGQTNDPRPGGPFRNDMVNLQTLLDVPLHSEYLADAAAVLIVIPMVTLFFGLVRRDQSSGSDLLKLSIVGLISMLPLYHRLYDGIMLMMLLAWGIGQLEGPRRPLAIASIILLSELLVPIDLVPAILHRTRIFDGVITSSWWQGVIVPHHAWGILILAVGSIGVLFVAYELERAVKPMMPELPPAPHSA